MSEIEHEEALPPSGETLAALEAERAAHRATREELTAALGAAAGRYREVLLAANPAIPPALLAGDSIESLDAALEQARTVVAEVLQRAGAPAGQQADPGPAVPGGAPDAGPPPAPPEGESPPPPPSVPAGAPVRSGPDTWTMSAVEKIRYALTHNR